MPIQTIDPGGNRRRQAELRERRRANMERVSVWLPREIARDLRAIAAADELPIQTVVAGLIVAARRSRAGEQPIF